MNRPELPIGYSLRVYATPLWVLPVVVDAFGRPSGTGSRSGNRHPGHDKRRRDYSRQLTESPRNGTALDGAFRAVVYPLIKLNRHWWLDGAVQFDSAPFFTEDFSAPGR